jgi:hypothetical protein
VPGAPARPGPPSATMADVADSKRSWRGDPSLMFWVHQLVEYLLGAMVVSQAVQSPQPALPLVVGAIVFLMAATADGPLAVAKVVPRPLHQWLDLALALALGGVAVGLRSRFDGPSVVVTAIVAVSMLFLFLRTDYRPKPVKRPRAERLADERAARAQAGSERAEQIGRTAGRAAAAGLASAQRMNRKRRGTPS